MKTTLAISAMALVLSVGVASAQTTTDTTSSQTTVAQPPVPVSPPAGVLSTEKQEHKVDAYGNRLDSKSTTYRDANGVVRDSQTTTTNVPPPPPPPVTTTTTTSTSTSSIPQ